MRAQPALTEALSSFAIHSGTTVGQSVEAVASVREGQQPLVLYARGREAANPYQPRGLMRKLADALEKSNF